MRAFDYFFYGDYLAESLPACDNPRAVLFGDGCDLDVKNRILSDIIECRPGSYSYDTLCQRISEPAARALLRIGLLRQEGGLYLDTPVIIKEDAPYLQHCFSKAVLQMADDLEQNKKEYVALAKQIDNGYSPEVNLYHLLCGAILDGSFFDCLSRQQVVATSRLHPSGLDYLLIVYERTLELERLSKRLLCSYNRCTDGRRALQSFGDLEGERFDVFRFICQKEQRAVSSVFKEIDAVWELLSGESLAQKRESLLQGLWQLVETGSCETACYRLLSLFGYVKDNTLAVPLYQEKDKAVIEELERLTEDCLYEKMCMVLSNKSILSGLFCQKHGISRKELANELYHIVFGQLNEELVRRGFVAKPDYREGEGRYLKSVELMTKN